MARFSKLAFALCVLTSVPQSLAQVADKPGLSDRRLKLMRDRALAIEFVGKSIPKTVEPKALFRYDDPARGYQDGTVWRLGKSGRPLAIVTTELHPRYGYQGTGRSNPRVVYDLLSLTPRPFRANSNDIRWRPGKSAVEWQRIEQAPKPADSPTIRLRQFKQLARRFKAVQRVDETGTDDQRLVLRLLPKNIDRYKPGTSERSDAAVFLFVAGRMPGVILFVETDGTEWQFAVGRLSGPSILSLSLDGEEVWLVPSNNGSSGDPYFATNGSAVLPEDEVDN